MRNRLPPRFEIQVSFWNGYTLFAEVRSWKLHLRSDKSMEDLAGMFNAKIRGWINYDGAFYRSALNKILWKIDGRLVSGAMRQCKRLPNHKRLAVHWLKRIACKQPGLFAHWQNVIPKTRKSRMSGDVYVRFRERLEGKFLGATRLILERV